MHSLSDKAKGNFVSYKKKDGRQAVSLWNKANHGNDVHGNGFAKGDEAKSEPEDCVLISH